MSDYINRQAAIDALGPEPIGYEDSIPDLARKLQWSNDVYAIKLVPSSDVRSIVFCKYCIHRKPCEYREEKTQKEKNFVCRIFDATTRDTDFCSFGEKKE